MQRTHMQTALGLALFAAGAFAAHAETPYYNPSNTNSPDKLTVGHDLYQTIGCPGKQLLDPACKAQAAAPTAAPITTEVTITSPKPATTQVTITSPAPAATVPAATALAPAPVDSDGDGVTDDKDQCSNTPAGRRVDAKGCEMDGDGDGVVDALDKCPTTPAGRQVDAKGCEMDGDGDSIVDALDKCPATPAGDKVDGKGCTLLDTIVLKGVNFASDSAILRADALVVLDEMVATLKRYPDLQVEVAGHTDSTASDAYNQSLSERRAKSVMDYFVGHGIDAGRLTAKGYGESAPIANNSKAAGRAQNRRVELR
ncbi:MAG: OmpA family protein, partial [Gallionellaceae bacterium]|nr:OmpA family protein [Gallionellaceae bacterium]